VNARQLVTLARLHAPASIRARVANPRLFTPGPITEAEWYWLVSLGWWSDGSSRSLDTIEGIRIGRSGAAYADAYLPANRHDFFYELGRIFGLDDRFKAEADEDYCRGCLVSLRLNRSGWRLRRGEARVWFRRLALRIGGRHAWHDDPKISHAPARAA
jgi:hypothetical protein